MYIFIACDFIRPIRTIFAVCTLCMTVVLLGLLEPIVVTCAHFVLIMAIEILEPILAVCTFYADRAFKGPIRAYYFSVCTFLMDCGCIGPY